MRQLMSTADFVSFVQKFAELARILLHGARRQQSCPPHHPLFWKRTSIPCAKSRGRAKSNQCSDVSKRGRSNAKCVWIKLSSWHGKNHFSSFLLHSYLVQSKILNLVKRTSGNKCFAWTYCNGICTQFEV